MSTPRRQMRWWREGGFRSPLLARLTQGRIGLGRWTRQELDEISRRARLRAEELRPFID